MIVQRFGVTKTSTKSKMIRTRAYDVIHEPFPPRPITSMDQVHFLKAQNGMVFSENYIRWAAKYDDKIAVCIHPDGCSMREMFEVSKDKNPEDYQYLDDLLGFENDHKKDES